MSDEEHEEEEGPSEAELALQRRRQGGASTGKGLTDTDKELLATNKEDRQRMDEEILELRQRTEKRKKEREEEEKRLAGERAAEEERRKAAEEEKKKKKEEEEKKRKEERAKKLADFDKMKNPTGPNFVISKRAGGGGGGGEEGKEGKKSKEQLEAEKKAILKQRIVPLSIDGLDQSGLSDKAKELHKLIYRLEGEKYDLEKRFKTQQLDMQELAERARQANKVGKEGLKRAQLGDGETDIMQERFAGTPAKVEMFSKYERQKDKRAYKERQTVYTGPMYVHPPQRIKPSKKLKWNEAGMPIYEDLPEGEAPPPAEVEAGGEE